MIEAITAVWTSILTWLSTSFGSLESLFWTAPTSGGTGSLTFLGILAVVSVGIGVVMMIIGVIQNFLHLRS